jgi:hypothetical protein
MLSFVNYYVVSKRCVNWRAFVGIGEIANGDVGSAPGTAVGTGFPLQSVHAV